MKLSAFFHIHAFRVAFLAVPQQPVNMAVVADKFLSLVLSMSILKPPLRLLQVRAVYYARALVLSRILEDY